MPPPSGDRYAQLLDAAAASFTRRGFHATTVQDIAAEAGVSVGLLYRYFDGKEALVVALIERYVVEVHRAVERADTLEAALEALFDVPGGAKTEQAEGTLFVEVMAEALRNDGVAEVVRQADTRVAVALADRIRGAQRTGEVAPDLHPDAAAELVLALGDGLAIRAALAGEVPPALDATLVTLLTRFLSPR